MKIIPLNNEEATRSGFTHKFIIPYTDLNDKTSGTAFVIYPSLAGSATGLTAGFRVGDLAYNVATAFTLSGGGTLVFSCGDAGDAARYVAASTDLLTAGYGESALTKKPYTLPAAASIRLTVTVATSTMAQISAGSLEIYANITNLAQYTGQ